MDFYVCKADIRKHLNDSDINFLRELSRIAADSHQDSTYERIGYDVLGPALLGYSSWLHREAMMNGANMIVFLAREGAILKRAYDKLFADGNIKTAYVNVSRVSLCRASVVYTKNLDDILRLFTYTLVNNGTTVREFFSRLGINWLADDYAELERKVPDITDREGLYDLITRRGMAYFYTQNMLLKKYLADMGISSGNIILSDVGYAGTMQSLLQNITPYVRYMGRYIIAGGKYRYKNNLMFSRPEISGYWTSDAEAWKDAGNYFRGLTLEFEALFLSAEGTTSEYVEIRGG